MKWFQVDATTDEDPRLDEIVAILEAKTQPDHPPVEWLRPVVHGVLLDTWCFTARQDKARPGYAEYSDQRPIPVAVIAGRVRVSSRFFEQCMDAAAEAGHISKAAWTEQRLVVFPAMVKRADTYTKRLVANSEQPSKPVNPKGKAKRSKSVRSSTANVRTEFDGGATPVSVVVDVPVSDLLGTDPANDVNQVDALVKLWNEQRKPGPRVMATLTAAKRKHYGLALKAMPNLADWRTVISWVNGQKWMNAPCTGDHPNWRADLDWLTKSGQLGKYLERARLDSSRMGDLVGRDAARGRTGFEPGKYADVATRA